MQRARIAHDLERIRDACDDAALSFTDGERITVNWKALPWKKLLLVAAGGAVAALAANVPDTAHIAGVSVQHILFTAAGALAGWAKKAPGDIKALPPVG